LGGLIATKRRVAPAAPLTQRTSTMIDFEQVAKIAGVALAYVLLAAVFCVIVYTHPGLLDR
jgi:hypothetical protein